MRTNFISICIAACFSVLVLISCQPHEEKTDNAFEQYKKEKLVSNDTNTTGNAVIPGSAKTEPIKKNESPQDEWAKFKVEVEKKILLNGNKIRDLKATPKASSKLLGKVERLEKENTGLRMQMDEYNKEAKDKLEKFKASVKQDAEDISNNLNDLTLTNKK